MGANSTQGPWPVKQVCGSVGEALNDVETELGFDDVAAFAGLEAEQRALEGVSQRALGLDADVAAAFGGAVFGVGRGKAGEIGTGDQLFEQRMGLLFGFRLGALDLGAGAGGALVADQDV